MSYIIVFSNFWNSQFLKYDQNIPNSIFSFIFSRLLRFIQLLDYLLNNFDKFLLYNQLIGLVGRVFTNGLGNIGSIPGHVIPKTLKMVLDTSLLNTQQYKVRIRGKVEQSKERSSTLPYTSV